MTPPAPWPAPPTSAPRRWASSRTPTTFTTAGTYYFWAVYSGDANNKGATSACDSETVVVDQNTTGITTQVKNNADDKDINNGTNVAIGTVAYDTADADR